MPDVNTNTTESAVQPQVNTTANTSFAAGPEPSAFGHPDPAPPTVTQVVPPPVLGGALPTASEPPAQTSTEPVVAVDALGYDTSTSDPALRGIYDMFIAKNVKADQAITAFEKAFESGNPNDINVPALTAMLGETQANVVATLAKSMMQDALAKTQQIDNKVLETVGGKENWDIIRAWAEAKATSDPEFSNVLQNYRDLMTKDETSAILVARALKSMYTEASVTRKPVQFISGTTNPSLLGISPILDISDFSSQYVAAIERGDANGANTVLARWKLGGGRNS